MQVAIALHQSRWLRLSVGRMILCADDAAEKQTGHDHTQNADVSAIAKFRRHTFSPLCFRIDLKHLSHPRTLRRTLLCITMAANTFPGVWLSCLRRGTMCPT